MPGVIHSSKCQGQIDKPYRIHKLLVEQENIVEDTYNTIFAIYLLQLLYNVLSPIRTSIIHNNDLKVDIPKVKKTQGFITL
jgi:hypothetical protein